MGCMWPAESVYVVCKCSCTSKVHLYSPTCLRIKIADLNIDRIVCLTRLQWDFTVISLVSLCCMNTLYLLCRSYDALSHMQLSAVLRVVTVAEWAVDVFWITMHWSYGVCFSSCWRHHKHVVVTLHVCVCSLMSICGHQMLIIVVLHVCRWKAEITVVCSVCVSVCFSRDIDCVLIVELWLIFTCLCVCLCCLCLCVCVITPVNAGWFTCVFMYLSF